MTSTIHIIGAGLAGLSAAVRLAERATHVVVHEATAQAGGRCRSYDDVVTGMTIDNGTHLLLSGNHAALSYLRTIGAADQLEGPDTATFDFFDRASRQRWTVRFSDGRLPWWIFDPQRRVPGTRAVDYLGAARLLLAREQDTIADRLRCEGPLYDRLLRPLLLAALNIEPPEGSAMLAAAVLRETLALGGKACRPLLARNGLGPAFIAPALAYIESHGGSVQLDHQLRAMTFDGNRIKALDFGADAVTLADGDGVILAAPPYVSKTLVPELVSPTVFRSIINAHFRVVPPPGTPRMIGVLNAETEWLFAFPDRMTVTISNSDRLLAQPREALAAAIWAEICDITGAAGELPPWQIVRERRATFATTPAECAKRPATATSWNNLFLAGDWTATGLPPTIEGSIRSGQSAADAANRQRLHS